MIRIADYHWSEPILLLKVPDIILSQIVAGIFHLIRYQLGNTVLRSVQ